jgi:hypothetical protein
MTSIRTTVLSSLLLFTVVVLMIPHDTIVVDAFVTSTFIVRKTRQYDSILGRRVPLLLVSVSPTEEDQTTTKEIIVNHRWWNQSVLATTKTTTTTSPDVNGSDEKDVAAIDDDNDKVDEEDETTRGRFRFRIINRIGNLTNRILRRNSLSEGAVNEEEESSTEEEETTPKEILTNNRWWNQSVAATTATTTDIDIDVDNLDEDNISNK